MHTPPSPTRPLHARVRGVPDTGVRSVHAGLHSGVHAVLSASVQCCTHAMHACSTHTSVPRTLARCTPVYFALPHSSKQT
eukprot:540467-Rhodomonas_salina.1